MICDIVIGTLSLHWVDTTRSWPQLPLEVLASNPLWYFGALGVVKGICEQISSAASPEDLVELPLCPADRAHVLEAAHAQLTSRHVEALCINERRLLVQADLTKAFDLPAETLLHASTCRHLKTLSGGHRGNNWSLLRWCLDQGFGNWLLDGL